jgi:shikimate dehydrogenase
MTITGHTRTYAHIGHPISHVRTPALYNELLRQRDIDVVVVPIDVSPDDLATMISAFRGWKNLAGIGVTIPHKESMVSLVDELTPMAKLCGATNVIRREADGRLVGAQFDGIGLVRSLENSGHDIAGSRVLLSGAGGTARAVAFALADAGAATIEITNRTPDKAEKIAAEVRDAFPGCHAILHSGEKDFNFVVNTTSLGMKPGDSLPVDPAVLNPGVVVADAVMAPPETELLKLAAQKGCVTRPGILMLQAQFDITIDFLGLT